MAPGALVSKGFVFHGSTHWSAMLEDIQGLRSAIVPSEATTSDDDILKHVENSGASLILDSAVPLPLQQVLVQYLPPRQEADRLTAAYFRSRGVSAPFTHASYFRRLYQDFWRDLLRAPVLWTSILFSICHIAQNILTLGKEAVYHDNRYNVASAHCLALGVYSRPKQFSVESLLLFVQAKCLTGLNATLLHFGSLRSHENEDEMNESIVSTNSFEWSLMQSPFAGDQASTQDVVLSHCLQDFPPERTEARLGGQRSYDKASRRRLMGISWAVFESIR
ncbi:MAG: hypothetical protein Q9175_003617 [Cornicularia normoerica]